MKMCRTDNMNTRILWLALLEKDFGINIQAGKTIFDLEIVSPKREKCSEIQIFLTLIST